MTDKESSAMEIEALFATMVPQMSRNAEILVTSKCLYILKDNKFLTEEQRDTLEKACQILYGLAAAIMAPLLNQGGDEQQNP